MPPETPGRPRPSDPGASDASPERPAGPDAPAQNPGAPGQTARRPSPPQGDEDVAAERPARRPAPRQAVPTDVPSGRPPRFRSDVEKVDERTGGQPAVASSTAGGRGAGDDRRSHAAQNRRGKVRARKVRRIVRHVEPWSVLKISLLFFLAVFVIVSVASALLWNAARSAGAVDDVESFITSVGGFGNCEPIDGQEQEEPTPTTEGTTTTAPPDQLDPEGDTTTSLAPVEPVEPIDDDEDCPEGQELVGAFEFEDGRILQAFVLGGVVLVLAGSATVVVMALLFNLISDLTGGLRVTVLEEEPPARSRTGSPTPRGRG